MLAMADELGHELWDDKTWEFPTFGAEEDCGGKLAADVSNSKGQAEEARPAAGAAKGKKRSSAAIGTGDDQGDEGRGGGGESDDHELHIWTERERRKKMRNMFANLHALLPHLPAKADKSTIVDEAVNYIKKLQETLQALEKEKIDRLNGLITNNPIIYDPSIITQQRLAIQSREAFLAEQGSVALGNPNPHPMFSGPEFPSIFKTWTSPNVILNVCGRDAHINVCSIKKPGLLTAICFVMEKHKLELVSAHVSSDRNRSMYMIHARGNGGSEQLSQAFPVEEIYKQAAAEIMLWVNS
ncbi:transcription factor bHLH95-like isoform X2 [Sesamum indicum]|uniref:Transcription factor bHLH95-like isoform X2 n=1 Tax=Sesamum indicum TaxID=4182 RepID=A0A6I9TRB1_SESIN|nr:transcription factor bHLH95-like isoform X2 [Sesamum indicum]